MGRQRKILEKRTGQRRQRKRIEAKEIVRKE